MIKEMNIYIGRFRCNMKYSNENEKKVLEEISSEVNKDFNKLLISFGRIDEKMLLFFMLLNLQREIFLISNSESKEDFFETFKCVSMFINQGANIENQLIVGLICKKNELREIMKKNKNLTKNNNNNLIQDFDNFFNNTIRKIKSITDVI